MSPHCAARGLPFTGRALEFAEAQVQGPLPLSPLWSRAELVRRRAERQARRRRR